MSGDFLALAQPGVQQLSPYIPGKPVDELARELDLDPATIVKLASNENPLGASPKALDAIRAELAELTRYPDGNGFALKSLLAEQCGVQLDQVTLGNGSNDILELVARAYLALAWTPFPALTQIAVFSAAGLVGAYLSAVCLLPALLKGVELRPAQWPLRIATYPYPASRYRTAGRNRAGPVAGKPGQGAGPGHWQRCNRPGIGQ